jgi:hypothetical protein
VTGKVTTTPQRPQKPHKWRKARDASCCIQCAKAFRRGDMVFDDIAVNIHVGCIESYVRTLKRLELLRIAKIKEE